MENQAAPEKEAVSNSRTEQIKGYLRRLSAGESLESVRADFAANFRDVEASEIMRAEQDLLLEGTPLDEVQKLCDVHSALFHGVTREENIAQQGHPLYTFAKENEAISRLIDQLKTGVNVRENLEKLRETAIHYAKKGDLIYPLLKVKYGISGPSEVMWTVDDEIRAELSSLSKEKKTTAEWTQRLNAVIDRMEEMVYKEANILFPICTEHFSHEEWKKIYRDSKDYAVCLSVEKETWEEAENCTCGHSSSAQNNVVSMPGGHLTVEQLTALLNTIPMEITFVDADDINRFFNEGPKVFKRPSMAIDRDVFSCHPPKIEVMVRQIIDDFRNGRCDSIPIWMEKEGRTMLVTYMAVRDRSGKYVGTVELVQDMEFAKTYFLQGGGK